MKQAVSTLCQLQPATYVGGVGQKALVALAKRRISTKYIEFKVLLVEPSSQFKRFFKDIKFLGIRLEFPDSFGPRRKFTQL